MHRCQTKRGKIVDVLFFQAFCLTFMPALIFATFVVVGFFFCCKTLMKLYFVGKYLAVSPVRQVFLLFFASVARQLVTNCR